MRHLFALFALALGLAACDESTTASTDTIPGPPDAPRLTLTVLTGTKAAPVDSPTVKIAWAYTGTIGIGVFMESSYIAFDAVGVGDTTVKIHCSTGDSVEIQYGASGKYSGYSDSAVAYCK